LPERDYNSMTIKEGLKWEKKSLLM
jgi:hypothetical protein